MDVVQSLRAIVGNDGVLRVDGFLQCLQDDACLYRRRALLRIGLSCRLEKLIRRS